MKFQLFIDGNARAVIETDRIPNVGEHIEYHEGVIESKCKVEEISTLIVDAKMTTHVKAKLL